MLSPLGRGGPARPFWRGRKMLAKLDALFIAGIKNYKPHRRFANRGRALSPDNAGGRAFPPG